MGNNRGGALFGRLFVDGKLTTDAQLTLVYLKDSLMEMVFLIEIEGATLSINGNVYQRKSTRHKSVVQTKQKEINMKIRRLT